MYVGHFIILNSTSKITFDFNKWQAYRLAREEFQGDPISVIMKWFVWRAFLGK
jgi:hypothetical protein